jgi:hypothetical protein
MTPAAVVDYLESEIGPQGAPQILADAIEVALNKKFGASLLHASEKAFEILPKIRKIIIDRHGKSEEAGTSAALMIVGSTDDVVCGCYYVMALDDDNTTRAKRNRAHSEELLQALRFLTFSEFEIFGKRMLFELGAGSASVSPHSNDQGIDFFGKFNFGQFHGLPKPFYKLAHDVNLLFAGQAKHYPNSALGPNIVRELIGAVSLARTKTHSKDGLDLFQDLEIRPFSPVVALLFTTGTLSSGAKRLAASAGMIAKDGKQLATFLADQGVGIVEDIGGRRFDKTKFLEWLNT